MCFSGWQVVVDSYISSNVPNKNFCNTFSHLSWGEAAAPVSGLPVKAQRLGDHVNKIMTNFRKTCFDQNPFQAAKVLRISFSSFLFLRHLDSR